MNAFDEYTSKFDLNDRLITLKYNHSYRVSQVSNILANSLGLDIEDVDLATTIGFIHDIGRFEQIKQFDTLSDINTMDHADFGAYLLFDKGLISKFYNKVEDYEIIKTAVSGHNKYSIDKEYDDRTLLHLKIIRDADKIDIFNIWANLDELELKTDGEISDKVREEFFYHYMIHNENKKTNADSIIGTLSYLYDINYNESFGYINSKKLITNLYNRIEDKEKFKEFFDYAEDYVESKVKGEKSYVRKKIQSLRGRKKQV